MNSLRANYKSLFLVSLLAVVAICWRVVNTHMGFAPNLELITTTTMVGAMFLGWRAVILVPLVSVAVSDAIIGNTNISAFTWTAWFALGVAALAIRRFADRPAVFAWSAWLMGVGGSTFFFLWTNLGVWALGHGSTQMYPHTWAGLVACFTMAIPFYKTMLIGNMILVPAGVFIATLASKAWASSPLPDVTLVDLTKQEKEIATS